MLKGFVGIFIIAFLIIAVIAAVILALMYKGIRNVREFHEKIVYPGGKKFSRQEYIRYQYEQREKNPFGKDYFKSSESNKKEEAKTQKTTTRRTTTSSGVTIIDDRETEEKKKIFDNSDGEYVEYEEV